MVPHRIGLIHATRHSINPIEAAFAAQWPEAILINLLDESLLADRLAAGRLTEALFVRIAQLADHSKGSGAGYILFTCSAFGPAIEAARSGMDIPVLKSYEAMIEEAVAEGRRVAVLATFGPTIEEMRPEIEATAARQDVTVSLRTHVVPEALDALHAGRVEEHDALIAEAAEDLRECDALMLAQNSMTHAANLIPDVPGRRVLPSSACAVARLRQLAGAQ